MKWDSDNLNAPHTQRELDEAAAESSPNAVMRALNTPSNDPNAVIPFKFSDLDVPTLEKIIDVLKPTDMDIRAMINAANERMRLTPEELEEVKAQQRDMQRRLDEVFESRKDMPRWWEGKK